MKTKKKKVIIIIMSIFMVALMVALVYWGHFFFGEKKYTYYITKDMGKISTVQLSIDIDGKNSNTYSIFDEKIINEILDQIELIKIKPKWSIDEAEYNNRGFSICLFGEENRRLSFMASEDMEGYQVWIGMEENGKSIDGKNELIGKTNISKEDGELLFSLVSKILEENVNIITLDDILMLSESEECDFERFRQFEYSVNEEVKDVTKGNFTSTGAIDLQIEGTEGYITVWFYNGVIEDENGVNRHSEVLKAIVYNEKGEEMNLYDEGISTFLEGME